MCHNNNKTASKHVVGIILAAGQASRMGDVKPIMPLDGVSSLERLINAYRTAGITDIRIVLGYHATAITAFLEAHSLNKEVRIVINEEPSRGMFSSVQTAFKTFDSTVTGAFIIPADIPLVKTETIQYLLEEAMQNPTALLLPTFAGKRGHPPLIPSSYFQAICEAPAERSTLRDIFNEKVLEIPCADSGILMDMDTPENYTALCEFAGARDYPTLEECHAIWSLLRVPEPVRKHSTEVAQIALTIGRLINHKTHLSLNLDKLCAAAMLHDIMKGSADHAKVGAEVVTKFGYKGIADAIGKHMKHHIANAPETIDLDIAAILYLSDKLCMEDVCISLSLHCQSAMARYPEAAARFIKERFQTAALLQRTVEALTQIESLDAYLSQRCI
jgi:CTP:molybdopterin cytidylyltransferase MocA/HD superfamily phosphohydrolase YqeK